jgi:hypothetical protein
MKVTRWKRESEQKSCSLIYHELAQEKVVGVLSPPPVLCQLAYFLKISVVEPHHDLQRAPKSHAFNHQPCNGHVERLNYLQGIENPRRRDSPKSTAARKDAVLTLKGSIEMMLIRPWRNALGEVYWRRYIRRAVYSAFESWQVFRHSKLYVKLPTITLSVRITTCVVPLFTDCLRAPCAVCFFCAACVVENGALHNSYLTM